MDAHFFDQLMEILVESVTHTVSMLPVLFAAYLFVEFVAHGRKLESLRRLSSHPIVGAITASALGLLPQCGFASAATVMYLDGLIPRGTLIASYIATSDEALPILLSAKQSVGWVLPLLLTKFVWGAAAGAAINLAGRASETVRRRTTAKLDGDAETVHAPKPAGLRPERDCRCRAVLTVSEGLEDHAPAGPDAGSLVVPSTCQIPAHSWKDLFVHALARTVRVGLMVLAFSVIFHIVGHLGEEKLTHVLVGTGWCQNLIAALVGLFPSCATSVAIADAFQRGMLSFSATVAGLSSNAGVALAILFKESKSKADSVGIAILLVVAGFLAGMLVSVLGTVL
ncbi:MAG: arsenic efflux protein [Firmicutes bacterium]|nr:arsenic efflux protein [Candidatus Fermentithermobacillaceae bacterium]